MNPFEQKNYLEKKIKKPKDLSFDEAYSGIILDDATVLEDERSAINYRLLILIVMFGFVALISRVYFLQVVKGDEYREMAEGNKLKNQFVLAPRGLLLDRNGKTIAGNVPSFELVVVPSNLPTDQTQFDANLNFIAQSLGADRNELLQTISKMDRSGFQPQTLVQNIPKDQALIFLAKQKELPGFLVQNNPIRDYKDPLAFGHLVGYTGKITRDELNASPDKNYLLNDYVGKTGLEVWYEDYLRGVPGRRQTEINASGEFHDDLPEVPAIPGNNVKLSIDYDLQKVLYDSMIKVMDRFGKKKAAAVATNPQTGEVLAYISLPGFDNNMFARGISGKEYGSLINDENNPLLNRVVAGTYPPGSTVKPMLALAALSEGVVTPQTKILDDGVIRIGSFTFYGYERSGLGIMDVYSAIARSSDIYFYTIGGGNPKVAGIEGLGPDKLAAWYRKFNLGKKLGIDIPNEKEGLVPDPEWKQRTRKEQWFLGNTYHYSIGQGDLLVTPLQVNNWTATLANGGKMMQPYIVNEAVSVDGKTVYKKTPTVLAENQFNPEWIKVVQDGMRQTVTAGSGRSMASMPLEIAGKTGTAQFSSSLTNTHAWFTSYAPFNNPQIALTVLVESGGGGDVVAVPISKEVYTWWAENRYNK